MAWDGAIPDEGARRHVAAAILKLKRPRTKRKAG
jgi:hypothetical protein